MDIRRAGDPRDSEAGIRQNSLIHKSRINRLDPNFVFWFKLMEVPLCKITATYNPIGELLIAFALWGYNGVCCSYFKVYSSVQV